LYKASAILLLAVFSVSLIPVAVSAESKPKLPACCRKDGKHGCAKNRAADQQEPSSDVAVKRNPKCSSFPKSVAAPVLSKAGVPRPADVLVAHVVDVLTPSEQAEAQYRVSFSRAWQKRGPPSLLA
jgi:hypothetical protein